MVSYVYYWLVVLIVRLMTKEKIITLDGMDAMFFGNTYKTKCLIHFCIYVDASSQLHRNHLIGDIKGKINVLLDSLPKLAGLRRNFMGISYLLHRKMIIDSYLRDIDNPENCDKETFMQLVDDIVACDMPANDTAGLQVWISKNKLINNQYGIVIRFDHVFGDGFTTMNVISRYIYDFDISKRKFYCFIIYTGYFWSRAFLSGDRNYEPKYSCLEFFYQGVN